MTDPTAPEREPRAMLAAVAAVGGAVLLVLAPAPPDAWSSIAVGCFGLGAAAGLAWCSPTHRRMLGAVCAVAAVHDGFAFDTVASQIGALALMAVVLARGLWTQRR